MDYLIYELRAPIIALARFLPPGEELHLYSIGQFCGNLLRKDISTPLLLGLPFSSFYGYCFWTGLAGCSITG